MGRFRQIISATRVIASLTLISRILGLVREMVFARYLGISPALSAFRIAFMVPNLARRLFGEGALSSSLIPVLSELLQQQGPRPARRLAGSVLTLLAIVLTGLVILVELVLWAVGSWQDEPAIALTAILLPYMVLICATAVLGGVLNVRMHFATPALTPVVLNVAIILAALAAAHASSRVIPIDDTTTTAATVNADDLHLIRTVCLAVLAAGVIQLAMQMIALWRIGFLPLFGGRLVTEPVTRVMRLMGPMVIGLSAVQISALLDYLIAYVFVQDASGQRVGPAVLGYAQYLYQLPLGVFGIALATAVFPILSERAAAGDRAGLADVFVRGVRLALFIGLPASAGLILLAEPIVRVLFERGDFDAADTHRTAGSVICYGAGVAAYCAQHVVVRTFYALKDSRTPVKVAATIVVLNVAIGLSLVFTPMQERGLALATAVTAIIQVIYLCVTLARRLPPGALGNIGSGLARMLVATAVMAAVVALLAHRAPTASSETSHQTGRLILWILAGAVSYALAARVLRIDELGHLLRRGSRR